MSFRILSPYYTDGYKLGHKAMLAEGTARLYGTWIPRSTKHAPKGISKIVSFGQSMTWRWIYDEYQENFFDLEWGEETEQFGKDISMYLGMEYDSTHFKSLHDLGYLPIKVQALTEGIETNPNIPHMTFINTVDGFAWLTLYLETIVSSIAWKPTTTATIALQYKRQAKEWIGKTDEEALALLDYFCHDFSSRGLSPWDMIASGLGHATSFRGSDALPVIPAARYFYGEPKDEVCINSVNASEHSVSTTKIFTVGESQMISDWLDIFPEGILSVVSDTFDLWKLITEYLPEHKEKIMSRNGKLVIRPDSGDPVDIICGLKNSSGENYSEGKLIGNYRNGKIIKKDSIQYKGVIELLWDIFGGTVNEQGYKVLDPHIGAIYGDSITIERQIEIYRRLEAKGFATSNIVLGIGSFTYQFNTRDTFGFAAKGAWFEVEEMLESKSAVRVRREFGIYKDPITDDGTKKSLKGFQFVYRDEEGEYQVESEVSEEKAYSGANELKTIFEDGAFYITPTLTEIRTKINEII